MSENDGTEDRQAKLFDEACRLTGLAYLMQVIHGDVPDHSSMIYELKRLEWLILVDSGSHHAGLKMAIDILEYREDMWMQEQFEDPA